MILNKQQYWEPIVEYYYDNIHWDEVDPPSIYGWLKREYNADSSLHSNVIRFNDAKMYNWFMLKFNEYARN
jgi:hypothetical protein